MAKDRGAGCPKRWRMEHSSRFAQPHRPPVCPCLWSHSLHDVTFKNIVGKDLTLQLMLSRLMTLWPQD